MEENPGGDLVGYLGEIDMAKAQDVCGFNWQISA